jgi:aldose 1-epimerase
MASTSPDADAASTQVCVIRDPSTGLEAHVVRAGASLQRLLVPVPVPAAKAATAERQRRDVVLGYASARDYLTVDPTCYLGAVVGRVANRVAGARFSIGGATYSLAANNGPNSLHGGARGLDRRLFDVASHSEDAVTLRYASPAGEEGYPGALDIEVTYSLPKPGGAVLRLEMKARCLAAPDDALPAEGTPVALAAHSYFNLAGCERGGQVLPSVLSMQDDEASSKHLLHMPRAGRLTALGPNQIPTGELSSVINTPFDFCSAPRALGEQAAQVPGVDRPGYDHNFVLVATEKGEEASAPGGLLPLPQSSSEPLPLVAVLSSSGLRMEVRSNAPGVQVYTGNYLGGDDGEGDASAPKPKDGASPYRRWAGVCLETQNWPDAVNRPGKFPSPLIKAGEEYVHVVEYGFSSL